MRPNTFLFAGSIMICAAFSANAQNVETTETASNGVVVSVNSDDFANRKEYTAPKIEFQIGDISVPSFAFVANVKKAGINGTLDLSGAVFYRGDWHFYNGAIFKGGDTANFTSTSRNVVTCAAGCSFSEGFNIALSPVDIAKHTENGVVAIQLRAQRSTDDPIIQVPRTYIDAVIELAKCDACVLKPPPTSSGSVTATTKSVKAKAGSPRKPKVSQ